MTTLSSLESRVEVLEGALIIRSEMMNDILGLSRSTLDIVTGMARNLGALSETVNTQLSADVRALSDTVNSRLGHSTSLTVFDALEDFRERLERIEDKLNI